MSTDADALKKLIASVERIERGMFGDEKLKQPGIIDTQQNHGQRIGRIEKVGIYIAGAGGCVGLFWTIFTQWPRH